MKHNMEPESLINFTKHAKYRVAQRGVCNDALELLFLYGHDMPAGGGCFRREIWNRQVSELHDLGFPLSLIERALRLEAVISEVGAVVTVYQRQPRGYRTGVRERRAASRRCARTRGAR